MWEGVCEEAIRRRMSQHIPASQATFGETGTLQPPLPLLTLCGGGFPPSTKTRHGNKTRAAGVALRPAWRPFREVMAD